MGTFYPNQYYYNVCKANFEKFVRLKLALLPLSVSVFQNDGDSTLGLRFFYGRVHNLYYEKFIYITEKSTINIKHRINI